MSASAGQLEMALKWIGAAERSGGDEAYRDAAARALQAVDAVLGDEVLWTSLKRRPAGPAVPTPQPRELHVFLGDRLIDVLLRVGYQPPPEAMDLVRTAEQLVTEAAGIAVLPETAQPGPSTGDADHHWRRTGGSSRVESLHSSAARRAARPRATARPQILDRSARATVPVRRQAPLVPHSDGPRRAAVARAWTSRSPMRSASTPMTRRSSSAPGSPSSARMVARRQAASRAPSPAPDSSYQR